MEKKWFEHVSTQYDMELYKKRIKEFSKYSDDDKKRYYQKESCGIIVQKYPFEFETLIYEKIAKLIVQNYPDFSDEGDIINTLKSAGRIYTMKVNSLKGNGFYHLNTADIGVFVYLDRISEELLHEVIHKLGQLKFNPDFYDMDTFYKEAGTEIITNKILGKKECKECIVRGIWTKSYGPDQEYLVQTSLVNQINQIMGGNTLEKSILQGSNEFQRTMEASFGNKFALELSRRIKEIIAYMHEYWTNYTKNGNDGRREANLMRLVQEFQNDLMHKVFDDVFENVQDVSEAEAALQRLVDYSDYRFKRKVVKDDDILFTDDEFMQYLNESKSKLEKRFDTKFDIKYDEVDWSRKHPIEYIAEDEKERRRKERKDISERARYRTASKGLKVILPRKSDRKKITLNENVNFIPDEEWIEKVELSFEEINAGSSLKNKRKKQYIEFNYEEP